VLDVRSALAGVAGVDEAKQAEWVRGQLDKRVLQHAPEHFNDDARFVQAVELALDLKNGGEGTTRALRQLEDSDRKGRLAAVKTLGKLDAEVLAQHAAALVAMLEDSEWRARKLPARLHVFGTTTTPPAFMDLLHRVGRDRDVTVFVPQPTPHYFGDLREKRDRVGDHGLLARFGTESRDFQSLLVDLEEQGDADAPITQHAVDEVVERDVPRITPC